MLQLVPQAVEQSAGPFTLPGARIIGVGDITQFIVKAAGTQTNNLVEIQANDGSQIVTVTGLGETILDVTSTEALLVRKNNDGGDVFLVDTTNSDVAITGDLDVSGHMGLGSGGAVIATAALYLVDTTTATAGSIYGQYNVMISNPAGASTALIYGGIYIAQTKAGNVQNHSALIGLRLQVIHYGSGSLVQARGFDALIQNTTAATMANAYSMYINSAANTGGGTITSVYGLYIANQTVGGTQNFAIYTGLGNVSFGDDLVFRQASTISTTAGDLKISPAAQVYFTTNVGIGVAAPDAPLEISSTVAVHLHIDGLDSGVAEIKFTNTTDTDGWYVGITGEERWGISRNIDIDTGLEFIMLQTGEIGIGTLPSGQLHIDQATDDASIPVLILDQADISEGFINFIGSDRGVIDEGDSSVESVRVELNGVVRRLALYADA